jgi:hypothetical protein
VRALSLAPDAYTVELGGRLCAALVAVLEVTDEAARGQVLDGTGPFETEALRQLTELPPLLAAAPPEGRTEAALEFLLAATDRDETVRAAVSVLGRLARAGTRRRPGRRGRPAPARHGRRPGAGPPRRPVGDLAAAARRRAATTPPSLRTWRCAPAPRAGREWCG